MKNLKSEKTKKLLPFLRNARRTLLLTGTPAMSRPLELYPQVQAVSPKLLGSLQEFAARYCDAKRTHFGVDMTGASHLEELQLLLEECVMVRRRKTDVASQLPPKVRRQVHLPPPSPIHVESMARRITEMTDETGRKRAAPGGASGAKGGQGQLLRLFTDTANMKQTAVVNYVAEMLDTTHKFLVYAHHQSLLDALCDMLQRRRVGYMRIDGATTADTRQRGIDRFQDEHDPCRVGVLSITAANSGFTLTV